MKLAGGEGGACSGELASSTCFLPHFLLTQPGISRATSLCPSAVGQKDGRWLWWGGGDSVSTCSAGPTLLRSSLCFGKETQKHTICWQQSVPGSPQALAGSWLLGLESWRPSWEWRLLQTQQQSGPGPCLAQPPAQGGDRAGLLRKEPFPASPLTKQPRKIQVPGEESYAKGSNGHSRKIAERLRALRVPYHLFSPRTWLFSQTLPTDKIYPL